MFRMCCAAGLSYWQMFDVKGRGTVQVVVGVVVVVV